MTDELRDVMVIHHTFFPSKGGTLMKFVHHMMHVHHMLRVQHMMLVHHMMRVHHMICVHHMMRSVI